MAVISDKIYTPIIEGYLKPYIKGANTNTVIFKINVNQDMDILTNYLDIKIVDAANNSILKAGAIEENVRYDIGQKRTCYFGLTDESLDTSKMAINQFYKMQIRLKGAESEENKVSYWSTIALFKYIDADNIPELHLLNFDTTFNYLDNILGAVDFKNNDDFLTSYRIVITKSDNSLVEDSGIINVSTGAELPINYKIKTKLENGSYKLKISYTSFNLYKSEEEKSFAISNSSPELTGTLDVEPHNKSAFVRLEVALNKSNDIIGILYIKRFDSIDNYSLGEIIYQEDGSYSPTITFIYDDKTAAINHWYKYKVCIEGNEEYIESGFSDEVFLDTDNAFLLSNDRQLNNIFNLKISSFKINESEAVTATIGSKYPIVRKNGNQKYKSFSINSLISFMSDNDWKDNETMEVSQWKLDPDGEYIFDIDSDGYFKKGSTGSANRYSKNSVILPTNDTGFYSKKEIFKYDEEQYNQYKINYDIIDTTDVLYERRFRDKVLEFLTDGAPKLFKTATEGNILVRLTGITLTPTDNLNNLTYSFSATATEIAEATPENCRKYNIVTNKAIYEIGTVAFDGKGDSNVEASVLSIR